MPGYPIPNNVIDLDVTVDTGGISANSANNNCTEPTASNNMSIDSTANTFCDITLVGTSNTQKSWVPFVAGLNKLSGQFANWTSGFPMSVQGNSTDQITRP